MDQASQRAISVTTVHSGSGVHSSSGAVGIPCWGLAADLAQKVASAAMPLSHIVMPTIQVATTTLISALVRLLAYMTRPRCMPNRC